MYLPLRRCQPSLFSVPLSTSWTIVDHKCMCASSCYLSQTTYTLCLQETIIENGECDLLRPVVRLILKKKNKPKNRLLQINSNYKHWFLSLAMSAIWSWLFCMLINCSDLFSVGRVFRPCLLLSNRRKIPCVWNIWRCEGNPRKSETVNNYV